MIFRVLRFKILSSNSIMAVPMRQPNSRPIIAILKARKLNLLNRASIPIIKIPKAAPARVPKSRVGKVNPASVVVA